MRRDFSLYGNYWNRWANRRAGAPKKRRYIRYYSKMKVTMAKSGLALHRRKPEHGPKYALLSVVVRRGGKPVEALIWIEISMIYCLRAYDKIGSVRVVQFYRCLKSRFHDTATDSLSRLASCPLE